MRAKILGASLLACLLSTTALADTSSMSTTNGGMGILENDYVRAGVNFQAGTLGSGGNTSPGLLYDSTGTGTFNTSYDYLTPGSPFDGFAIKIDGANTTNNNQGNGPWVDADGLTDGDGTLTWNGTASDHAGWEIENIYSLGATDQHIDITTNITAGSAATDVWFSRFIDPDARAADGDSSQTDNVLGYGVIPDSNVAFSEALSSRYALGLYSTDSNVDAGITSPWSREGDGYTDSPYTDTDGNSINYGQGDHAIGLSWYWSGVSAGDILTANYAYIFGPSAFAAADTAITAGAGGGADTSSWGTLEDVGSATDAAESGGSTPDPVITYSDPVVDTDRPVLTASITHHESSVADGVQTIDRERTTTTTTPMEIIEYTDGEETDRAVTDSVITTAVTDPGSFVGRMDQADQMLALNTHRNLGIGNGISGGRITHDMGNGYSAESIVLSVGGNVMLDNGVTAGLGYNRVNTDLTGADSTGTMESNVISAQASKHIDDKGITVTGNVNVASSDITYNRSIGDFAAAGSTTGRDMWAYAQVEKSTGTVRPFAGFTFGNNSVEAYDETGDIQATLSHAEVDEQYKYATVGLNIDTGLITATLARDFDDAETMRYGVGIDRNINERINFSASATRSTAGDNTSTHITAGIKISF